MTSSPVPGKGFYSGAVNRIRDAHASANGSSAAEAASHASGREQSLTERVLSSVRSPPWETPHDLARACRSCSPLHRRPGAKLQRLPGNDARGTIPEVE